MTKMLPKGKSFIAISQVERRTHDTQGAFPPDFYTRKNDHHMKYSLGHQEPVAAQAPEEDEGRVASNKRELEDFLKCVLALSTC
jgi:hypothetical protein